MADCQITADNFRLTNRPGSHKEILKTFCGYDPFEICFSEGIFLRIKNRYVPTVSVLQVFLQTVSCLWSVDHFLALEIGWSGLCKHCPDSF